MKSFSVTTNFCNSIPSFGETWIGVDPGNEGAIAWINSISGLNTASFTKLGVGGASKLVHGLANTAVFAMIERMQVRPGVNRWAVMSMGKSMGFWIGLMVEHGIPYKLVPYQTWQSRMLRPIGGPKGASKFRAYLIANALYPFTNWTGGRRLRKKQFDSGVVDAALISTYAKNTWELNKKMKIEVDKV